MADLLQALLAWDAAATAALNGVAGSPPPPAWDVCWGVVSAAGGSYLPALGVAAAAWEPTVAGALRRARGRRFAARALAGLLAVGAAAALTSWVLKPLFDRSRPGVVLPALHVSEQPAPRARSFPSGHAAAAGAAAAAIVWLQRRRRAIAAAALAAAAVVALSRVIVGVHFVLDSLAGLAVGLAAGAVVSAVLLGRLAPSAASAVAPVAARASTATAAKPPASAGAPPEPGRA
ncbi:MAG TPA: phosphatase PAP2 family protein [Myxococcota bacterium]|jgi:undecaprenyl-diphosphatase|nr:phosphatase PAP2 family protein [Myxococcota bacterium]